MQPPSCPILSPSVGGRRHIGDVRLRNVQNPLMTHRGSHRCWWLSFFCSVFSFYRAKEFKSCTAHLAFHQAGQIVHRVSSSFPLGLETLYSMDYDFDMACPSLSTTDDSRTVHHLEEIRGESRPAWCIAPRLPTRLCMFRDGSRSIYPSPSNVGAMGGYSDGRAVYTRIGSSQVIRAIKSDDLYREEEQQSIPVAAS
jgi:hypothetical protein